MSICRKSINLERYWAWLAEEDTELAAANVFRLAVAKGSPPDGSTKPPRWRAASMVMILSLLLRQQTFSKSMTPMGLLHWTRSCYACNETVCCCIRSVCCCLSESGRLDCFRFSSNNNHPDEDCLTYLIHEGHDLNNTLCISKWSTKQ
jgi:hypothetical protein